MTIYFLRHASAGQPKKDRPEKDEKRALDPDGIEQCRYIGSALAAMDIAVDALLSSPLKRATQTASLVGNEMGYDGRMQIEAALRPGAAIEDFRALLAKYSKCEAIMVVGHNPNLSEFLSLLISEGQSDSAVDLKKGAVARVETRGKSGTLEWLLTPKSVRTIYASAAGRKKR
jgi:phosphohistidine phosphatase